MKRQGARSGLFIGELTIAVLIFALCMTVCIRILVKAHTISEESTALNRAVFLAENSAEAFRTAEDLEALALLLGGQASENRCEAQVDGFTLAVTINRAGNLKTAEITVSNEKGTVYSLESSVYVPEGVAP